LQYNDTVLNNEDATQRFVTTLQQQKSRVQEMPGLDDNYSRTSALDANNSSSSSSSSSIKNSLTRNQQLNRVDLLLLAEATSYTQKFVHLSLQGTEFRPSFLATTMSTAKNFCRYCESQIERATVSLAVLFHFPDKDSV
jgi:hypothetical protein